MKICRIKLFLPAILSGICSLLATQVFADSQIRIVRLSDVDGAVQINRNLNGFEKAFLNLPVVQGNTVRTGADGRAQIEFEDGSALRLAPDTIVVFSQLSLSNSGTRMSAATLQSGTAYVDFKDAKQDELAVTFGQERIVFTKAAHLRIQMARDTAAVAVFSGDATVESPAGAMQLSKNRTGIFNRNADDPGKLAKNIDPAPYDGWDRQQDQYQQKYSRDGLVASATPYSYGAADLNYYGSYFNAPGYGLMWQPYFASAGWDPFMNGAWAFYPGIGYGWVSAYPWGWTPFHSGNWIFIPGRGWGWSPGGTWTAVNTRPQVLNAPAQFVAPRPPTTVGQSLVLVNRGGLAAGSGNKVVIRNNSAGLGIPRGEVNNLAKISGRVNQRGFANVRLHTTPITMSPGASASTFSSINAGSSPRPSVRASSPAPVRSAVPSVRSSAPAGRGRN